MDIPVQKIKDILSKHVVNGVISLPKDYGMFAAKGLRLWTEKWI